LGVGVDGLPNTDCGCAGPFEVPGEGSPKAGFWNENADVDEVLAPEEDTVMSSFFPKGKTDVAFE